MDQHFMSSIAPVWHRAPALFEAAPWARWATLELVEAGLRALPRCTGVGWRLFDGEEKLGNNDVGALIRPDEATLVDYLARLRQTHVAPGLIVNDIQVAAPDCWVGVAPLLASLYAEYGLPLGGALVDLFLTGRGESFFGVHKDDQDVFMFVVAGCKRVELWRYETLAQTCGAPGWYEPRHEGQVAIEPAPELSFEVRAGDVAYWPAGYWHRIHNLDELTVGLSLGLFTRPDPLALLARLERFDVGASQRQPTAARRGWAPVPGADCHAELDMLAARMVEDLGAREHLLASLVAWKSSLGFRSTPRTTRPATLGEQRVRLVADALLEVVALGEQLLVGASGHAVRYPNDPGLAGVLADLRRCEPMTLTELDAVLCAADSAWLDVALGDRIALLDKLVCDLIEVYAAVPARVETKAARPA